MRKSILIIIILLLILVGCQSEETPLKFATGSIGGTYYPLGSAMAEVISDHGENITVNSYMGNASVSNSQLIDEGQVDMALVQGNVAYWASTGSGMFEGESTDKIKGIAALYSEAVQIVVRKDLNIRSFEDLEGKRLNIGLEGSGHYSDAVTIIEAHGMNIDDFNIKNYSFVEASQAFQEDEIDATIITSGLPTSSVMLLSNDTEVEILSLSPDIIGELMREQSYYTSELIDKTTYPFVEGEVRTIATKALWVCSSDLNEDTVYEMTKAFWENYDSIDVIERKKLSMNRTSALMGMSVELHPGALKYYKEMESLNE